MDGIVYELGHGVPQDVIPVVFASWRLIWAASFLTDATRLMRMNRYRLTTNHDRDR